MLGGGVPGLAHAVEHAVSQVEVPALPGERAARQWHSTPQQGSPCQEGKSEQPLLNEDTRTQYISFFNVTNLISCITFRYMTTEHIDIDIQNFRESLICLIANLVSFRETAKYFSQQNSFWFLFFVCCYFVLCTFRKKFKLQGRKKRGEFHHIF